MNLYEDENAYYYSTLITCVPLTSRLANRLIWSTNELIVQRDSLDAWAGKEHELNPHQLKRPMNRDYLGALTGTVADANWLEAALGTNGRSAEQWDIWQAVYSPQGSDGCEGSLFRPFVPAPQRCPIA